MRLLEFQAKKLFSDVGIPVPTGTVVTTPEGLSSLRYPAVLKSQVPAGGRGKAGGILIAQDARQGVRLGTEMLTASIGGIPVSALLCEEVVRAERELFLSLMIDASARQWVLLAGAEGGIDVEHLFQTHVDRFFRRVLDPAGPVHDFVLRAMARSLRLTDPSHLRPVVQGMLRLARDHDATLVEINPLAETRAGLVALDAKVILDDKAHFRHREMLHRLQAEQDALAPRTRSLADERARNRGLRYVPMDGDIGVISDGAGTGMLTLDLIQDAGGRPANFCEMGGLSNAQTMREAMETVLADPRVKVLLIGLIGGLTRMDDMAQGIVDYLEANRLSVPVVVRMCGTQEEVGLARLQSAGISATDNLEQAVLHAVELSGG